MTTTILAPVDRTAPKKIGRKTFRKQIIRKGTIDYPNGDGTFRRVTFDDAYLDALNLAHQQGAYDDVAFILADADNKHTMAPERFRGWIKGMERTDDGIDAILELSDDAAELVERTDYKLGVSPRIKPVQHVDGRKFPAAINHVLGTLDPRLQGPTLGLKPWEPVDLATPDDDVLDLSGATYREDRTMPRTINLDDLDPAQADALASYAALAGIDLSTPGDEPDPDPQPDPGDPDEGTGNPGGDDEGTGDGDDVDTISDEDLEALIDAELVELGLADTGTDLSTPDDDEPVDLSADPVVDEAATLRVQLASRDYVAAGVPPAIVDLAAPFLALGASDALDLSTPDGASIDVRTTVAAMLDAMKGTVDLSTEAGHGLETEDPDQVDATTQAWLDHVDTEIG